MEEKSKVIKVNCNLLDQITKWGNIPEVVKELLENYDVTKVTIKQNESFQFFFCVGDREIPFNVTGVTKPIRVPIEIYNELLKAKIYPEESFSSVLFRLITFNQKEEIKKPYLLHLFVYPKDEWFDEKGDFKYNMPNIYNGPMLESYMMVDSVEEIAKLPKVAEKVDIRIISCYDEIELQQKYLRKVTRKDRYPLMVFKEVDDEFWLPLGYIPYDDMEEFIINRIETDEEAEKLGFTRKEYDTYIKELEAWKKKLEKVRKCKATRAANSAIKKAERLSEDN